MTEIEINHDNYFFKSLNPSAILKKINGINLMEIYTYPSKKAEAKITSIINRSLEFKEKDLVSVTQIINNVKKNGDNALIKFINRFDSPDLTIDSIRVREEEFKNAEREVDEKFISSLNCAIKQVKSFHQQQVSKSWIDTKRSGTFLGQLINPVDAAGIYVPGGKGGMTPLVSSVIMGGVPAVIAGVNNIAITTPPKKDGTVSPHLLVAAEKIGIKKIYKAGSAWAIAALAHGTETIDKVDVIVGPGNIYVTLAKKIVSETVGIDMIAGPSEILIIADKRANPEFIASDLLSQAEHDPLASAILVTDSEKLAKKVAGTVSTQVSNLCRKEIAEESLKKYGAIIVVPNISSGLELANGIAPEHLEIITKDPFEHIGAIRNAGAVFLGDYTPEPVGDYIAGPNHVLPTAGTARFASSLSVDNFIKKTSLLHYSKEAFHREADHIIRLAAAEGLDGHANSIKIRLSHLSNIKSQGSSEKT